MSPLSIVTESTIRKIATTRLAYDAVKAAFESMAEGQAAVVPPAFAKGMNDNEVYGAKIGNERKGQLVGLKVGSYWPGNFDSGLPNHGSTTLLLDPATGYPQALVSAGYLNGLRTAAANGVATSYLARKNASVLGVIGAGHQAEFEIRAVADVRSLSLIKIWSRSSSRVDWLMDRLKDLDMDIQSADREACVRSSDIVATVTPSKEPLVDCAWIEPGMHISAMGSDGIGKQELDPAIFRGVGARLFADYPEQSVRIGEFQHALKEGIIASAADICPIGAVSNGSRDGRLSESDVTVFDSSGIATQDLTVAKAVLDAATASGQVTVIDF